MEKKIMKYIKFGIIAAACALLLAGCVKKDQFEPSPEAIIMTGTDNSPMIKFAVEETPAVYPVTVSSTGRATSDIKVNVAIDNSLVEKYNKDHKTSYYALPESALQLDSNYVVIPQGATSSKANFLHVVTYKDFVDGRIYIIPITITSVENTELEVLETSRTLYLRISRVVYFNSLDISDYGMYSNFIFDDALAVDLPTYTYEIKCFINQWHPGSEPISRLCQWTSKTESRSNMLRFGENGQDINSLQWVHPAGNIVSKARFTPGNWYTISLTYNGSVLAMYVDGVKDVEAAGDGTTNFQRFELGMSWGGGYPQKQRFLGRVCEVKVWNRALSPSEIQLGICGVDPTSSEGLVAYWKFNEGEGHIFHDATGHGYDMDWSKTVRDNQENGVLNEFDYSAKVEAGWIFDDKNKCAN